MTLIHTLLRLMLGATFIAHGAQKLLGWFGGGGLEQTTREMEELQLEPARANAVAVGATQFGSGVLLTAGLLTPVACTLASSSMLTAIWAKCAAKGFFSRNGGYEYPVLLTLGLVVVAGEGPGPASADRALGLDRSGAQVALLTAAAAGIGSAGIYAAAKR
jgi:putative oxidoreductase